MGLADLFKRETPQEAVRRWQRVIRSETRAVDRQIDITREAKKTEASIREAAKRGDARSTKILALELLRTRKAVTRLHTSKAQMNSVSMHLSENLGTPPMHKAVGHLQKSTEVMKLMGSVLKHSVVAKQMTELSREMMKAGVMDEMVGEALDGVLDGPDAEEETEAEVDKVLSELAADTGRALPAAGRPARAAPAAAAARAEAHEEEDAAAGMQARLDALRAA